jgi:hypothetical protein
MPRGGSCDKAKAGKAGKAVKLLTFYYFIFITKSHSVMYGIKPIEGSEELATSYFFCLLFFLVSKRVIFRTVSRSMVDKISDKETIFVNSNIIKSNKSQFIVIIE